MILRSMGEPKLIGHFSVDSGQAIVGDPCYLDKWKLWDRDTQRFDDHENSQGEYGYLGASNATLGKSYGVLGNNSAVAFSTGYGDGLYPVFALISDEGRILKIIIDFDGQLDENGDTRDDYDY